MGTDSALPPLSPRGSPLKRDYNSSPRNQNSYRSAHGGDKAFGASGSVLGASARTTSSAGGGGGPPMLLTLARTGHEAETYRELSIVLGRPAEHGSPVSVAETHRTFDASPRTTQELPDNEAFGVTGGGVTAASGGVACGARGKPEFVSASPVWDRFIPDALRKNDVDGGRLGQTEHYIKRPSSTSDAWATQRVSTPKESPLIFTNSMGHARRNHEPHYFTASFAAPAPPSPRHQPSLWSPRSGALRGGLPMRHDLSSRPFSAEHTS